MILNGGVGSAFDVVIHTKDMQHLHLDRYNNIKTRHSIYCVLFFNTTYVVLYISSHDIYLY